MADNPLAGAAGLGGIAPLLGAAGLGGALPLPGFTGTVTDSFTVNQPLQAALDQQFGRLLDHQFDQLQPQQRYQVGADVETRDQIIERHIHELQAWDRAQEEREKFAKADTKAWALFKSFLTPEQLKTYEDSFIIVHGQSGSRYRLFTDRLSFNIAEINPDGGEIEKYCAYPFGVPSGDVYLTQKLWLEADDQQFKSHANRLGSDLGGGLLGGQLINPPAWRRLFAAIL